MDEKLRVIISAEISRLKQNVETAKKSIKDFAKNAKDKLEDVEKEFKEIGDAAKNSLKVVGGAIAGATAALVGMSAATAEYRNNQAKLQTAFEAAGGSAKDATKTYNDLYRVLGDDGQATEAAQQLANITTNEKELAEWTTICQGVYAKMGESIPVESLAEGASEAIRTGTATAGLTDALVWAGVAEDEFNAKLQACNTEAERETLIRTTLNGLYSDAAAKYETNNAALLAHNEAQAKMTSAMARVGEAIQPILTALTTLGAQLLEVIAPYIEDFVANHLPNIQTALAGVAEKIGLVIGWISDNWTLISNVGTFIITIIGTLSVLSTVISTVSTVLAIATSPISLVALGIAALIAVIVLCIKNWEKIKEVVGKVADWIKEKVAAMKEAVVNKFEELRAGMVEKINAVRTKCSEIVQSIVNTFRNKFNSAKSTVLGVFDSIRSGIEEKINAAKNFVGDTIEKIKGFFDFEWSLPNIPMPHFSVTGKLDLLVWPPQVPTLAVEWYAKGGVFDKPTLFGYGGGIGGLGEAGAEAVVPLEKNTKWLDIIADKLAARQSNQPIVLEVDGKVFAQTSINSINQLTKQTGKLGLALI